jgi:predicted membrane chloride channel (bestrophin family)
MGIHSEAQLDRKYMEMIKLLNIYLNHFPRHEKYALANRIRNTAYGLYEHMVEAQKRYHKKTALSALDVAHETLRMQIRLAHELGYFRFKDGKEAEKSVEQQEAKRLIAIGEKVDELGRMIGGWINHEQNKGGALTCA